VHTYTAPSGPNSINNEDDAEESALVVSKDLQKSTKRYDGYLVACYSVHPLIPILRTIFPAKVPVVGIFESSVSIAVSLMAPPRIEGSSKIYDGFGIVTTGKYWEKVLTNGVLDYLGSDDLSECKRFKGVESTGLNASELHDAPAEEVRKRMIKATRRLVKNGDVSAICLGCAGMAGMDAIVREACIEELGQKKGEAVHIIDGVKAGIAALDGLIRSKTAGV
jgi:Asp/Glu/hydantoin racemase